MISIRGTSFASSMLHHELGASRVDSQDYKGVGTTMGMPNSCRPQISISYEIKYQYQYRI